MSGIAAASAAAARAPPAYSTAFAGGIENPLSEGGKWLNGAADGVGWNNCQVTANGCVGSQDTLSPRYADDNAMLKTSVHTFAAHQYVKCVLYLAAGYTGGGGKHECEMYVHMNISANSITGFEISVGQNAGSVYAFITRWDGAVNSFTTLIDPGSGFGSYTNTPAALANGQVYEAEITAGGVMTLRQSGIVIVAATDATHFTSGQPGLGFWPVDGAVKTSQGWKYFEAGDLP